MRNAAEQQKRLEYELNEHYLHWKVLQISVANQGVESVVFRIDTELHGILAIKVPWERIISSANVHCDTRDLLTQECYLSEHAAKHGILSPKTIVMHRSEEATDFLAMNYIFQDKTEPDPYALGTLVRKIHECQCLHPPFVIEQGLKLEEVLTERLTRRARTAERLTKVRLDRLTMEIVSTELNRVDSQFSLLHMDIRPANIFTKDGQILAISDWSNALHGPPSLEIARIAEYGHVDRAFYEGYGSYPFDNIPRSVELLYRLDTSVMLCVLFHDLAPDPELGANYLSRVSALYEEFAQLDLK